MKSVEDDKNKKKNIRDSSLLKLPVKVTKSPSLLVCT